MATHDDMETATAPPPNAASRTAVHTTSTHEHATTTTDPIAQRVMNFVTKPARTAFQEYLRINAATAYLKAVGEGPRGRPSPTTPTPTPSPTPTPEPQATAEGRKAAASIVGCMLEAKFSPNDRTKAAQAIVLRYLGIHYPQYADKVKNAFVGKSKAPFIQLVKAIIEDVEDHDDELFDELVHGCDDD